MKRLPKYNVGDFVVVGPAVKRHEGNIYEICWLSPEPTKSGYSFYGLKPIILKRGCPLLNAEITTGWVDRFCILCPAAKVLF